MQKPTYIKRKKRVKKEDTFDDLIYHDTIDDSHDLRDDHEEELLINEEDRFLKSVYNNKNIKDNNNQIIVTDKLDINELTYFFYIHNLYKIKPLTDKIKDYFSSVNLWKYIALNDVKLPIKKEINRDLDDENLQLISKVFCSTDDLNKPNFLKPPPVPDSPTVTFTFCIF